MSDEWENRPELPETEEIEEEKKASAVQTMPEEGYQPVPEEKWTQVTEALLFASGDSVPLNLLAKTLGTDPENARRVVEELAAAYDADERGMRIVRLDKVYQMTSRPMYYPYVGRMIHSALADVKLTETQLETLSIIAYRQPVTKIEIEQIRGVRADAVVNRLVDYGLVEEKGRLKAPGRPILFGTTESFLRYFGMADMQEMPHMAEVKADTLKEEGGQLELGDLEILDTLEENEEDAVPDTGAASEE